MYEVRYLLDFFLVKLCVSSAHFLFDGHVCKLFPFCARVLLRSWLCMLLFLVFHARCIHFFVPALCFDLPIYIRFSAVHSAQYTMNVSSRGSEVLFSSLASAPLFSMKLVVGAMSGVLLTDYCPSLGHCDSQHLWSIVGATSLLSPVLMVFLRSCIESRESEDRDTDGGAATAAAMTKLGAAGAEGAPTEATTLLPRSRADVFVATTTDAVRVDSAMLDQGKTVVAKSRPMAIPDDG